MRYEDVTQPLTGPEAFAADTPEAAMSQAAVLLLLGRQIRGDDEALRVRAAAVARPETVEALPDRDLEEFPVPRLELTGERFAISSVRQKLSADHRVRIRGAGVSVPSRPVAPQKLSDIADRLYSRPEPLIAAELMEASCQSSNELTRVAAAISYFDLTAEPARLLKIIERGAKSDDELVRELAATALARYAPDSSVLRRLTRRARKPKEGTPSHTSLLVHGTFARNSSWWQPGGDFHTYLLNNVRPDLYSAADRFEWSGGYSDGARSIAARALSDWVTSRSLDGLDLFTHSHGGNAAMLASQSALTIGKLVLLSCPVHVHKYFPDFTRVAEVISIRVRLDLVILADRGGQRFSHPNIQENVLPIWFNHSATHEESVWRRFNLEAFV